MYLFRKEREEKLQSNSAYIHENHEKKASAILKKHHYTQIFLTSFKEEK